MLNNEKKFPEDSLKMTTSSQIPPAPLEDVRDIDFYSDVTRGLDKRSPFERVLMRHQKSLSIDKKEQGIQNIYQELHMHSRFVDAHRDINDSCGVVDLHSHTFVEILYCISGDVDYLLGANRYHVQKGDVVIIPPGISHRPILRMNGDRDYYERVVVWISSDLLWLCQRQNSTMDCSLFLPESGNGLVLNLNRKENEYIKHYFERIAQEAEHALKGWETVLCGNTLALMALLQRVLSQSGSSASQTDQKDLLDLILQYIEDNLKKISLWRKPPRSFM